MKNINIPVWELLQKQMTWKQLGCIQNKKILDFGSGQGLTASHFALSNEVIAIEPDDKMLSNRFTDNDYVQIHGDVTALKDFEDQTFDIIICHNVFEYTLTRQDIIREFSRILKKDGTLSILKHNKPGRVMQMVVLLNNFEAAHSLLNGENGLTQNFGNIYYYNDTDLTNWCNDFKIEKVLGMRTFWDLQQNQDIQKDIEWQTKILDIEEKVSDIDEFKAISFFHHVILTKI